MSRLDRKDISAQTRQSIKPLTSAGYEDAIAAFRHFDKNLNGRIDFKELQQLMSSLHRCWTESKTAELMQAFDYDRGGDIDIREFLNLVFPRKTSMGGTGGGLSDYDMLVEQFMLHDRDRSGILEKSEFHQLMNTLQNGHWSWAETQRVFDNVDKDGSGAVDVGELVAWILGVQRPSRTERAKLPANSKKAKVIVEVVTNRRGQRHADYLQTRWSQKFNGEVAIKKVVELEHEGHDMLVKRVSIADSDVVFWDRATMMAYREDPFAGDASRRHFAEELERGILPQIIESIRQ